MPRHLFKPIFKIDTGQDLTPGLADPLKQPVWSGWKNYLPSWSKADKIGVGGWSVWWWWVGDVRRLRNYIWKTWVVTEGGRGEEGVSRVAWGWWQFPNRQLQSFQRATVNVCNGVQLSIYPSVGSAGFLLEAPHESLITNYIKCNQIKCNVGADEEIHIGRM